MKSPYFPEQFKEKYKKILGEEFEKFIEFCKKKSPKCIWANSHKVKPQEIKEILEKKGARLEELKFHENAFQVEGIEKLGALEEFKKGFFNIQDKASMLPAIALDPKEGDVILDMCAAPGNKTIQISNMMGNKGTIFAFERKGKRYKSLIYNIRKFDLKNVKAFRMNILGYKAKNYFDKILLDAPCSNEALVRKEYNALRYWSQSKVKKISKIQRRLLLKAYEMLKQDGELLYSTCSLSPEENEYVVKYLIKKRSVKLEDVVFKDFKLRDGIDNIGKRVLPQDNDSEAFYICKLKKI